MLKIDRVNKHFSTLTTPSLANASITERYDLQEYICNSPDAFFNEIGQDLYLIGKEIQPSKTVQDRIDILAIDKEGCCVVVELKRGNHKLHMFQAISYAGMISQWEPDDFLGLLSDDQQEALVDFLEVEREDINRQQRIILIAEAYDYSLLIGSEWLSERFGVGILCCRIAVAGDEATGLEYLVCSNVYPAPELANEAIARGRKSGTGPGIKWPNWESALENIENTALVAYFKKEIASNQESYLLKRILRYRIAGKRRWFMAARREKAYVWQQGRFEGDVDFWQQRVSRHEEVKPVKDGLCLRLFLESAADFEQFHDAATKTLTSKTWLTEVSGDDLEESESG